MAVYKISELYNSLVSASQDGCEYVELSELPPEDGDPACLLLNFVFSSDYDSGIFVDSVSLPDSYDTMAAPTPKASDICTKISFSYKELFELMNAVNNALEYGKERLSAPSCTRQERDDIKASSVELRNLQAKFTRFCKDIGVKV